MTGHVTLIGGGPGDPDLITMRGYRALQAADVVLYDDLVDEGLLDGLGAERIYVGKRCGTHAMPQEKIIALMSRFAARGLRVARLKGGDPTVFGRGGEEAAALLEQRIPVEIIPGVTSAVSVSALAGIPVTHRGVADSFTVVTAHRRLDQRDFSIPPFNPRSTVVVLMGVQTLPAWVAQMRALGYADDLPVAFVMNGATAGQRVVETTLVGAVAAAEEHRVTSPAIAIVGYVVRLRTAVQPSTQAASVGRPVDEVGQNRAKNTDSEHPWRH